MCNIILGRHSQYLPIFAPLSKSITTVGILDLRLAQPKADMPSPSTALGSAPRILF